MTKEDIYTKLEYNGKYNTKIKTNLRNMIKENKENKELSKLLLEVQNELETGRAKIIHSRMTKKDNNNESSTKIKNSKAKNNTQKNKNITEEIKKDENSGTDSKEIKKGNNKDKKKKDTIKSKNKKVSKKKKKKSLGSIIGKIFIILFALLMIASSVSTIFSYFR